MKLNASSNIRRSRGTRGLTLVEIMVASSLLLVILIGLMLMFNQTQKAFRAGLRQNDVMENGRTALDMIARDLEQMAASHRPEVPNLQVQLNSNVVPLTYVASGSGGVSQTQFLQSLFFLQNFGDWQGMGYRVFNTSVHTKRLNDVNDIVVGTLYTFRTNAAEIYEDEHLNAFHDEPLKLVTNGTMHRLVEGVVHFKVTLYDKAGIPMTNNVPTPSGVPQEIVLQADLHGMDKMHLYGSALPAAIDLEMGILEPQAMEQIRPLVEDANYTAIRNYLSNHSGKIHIFRRHIPIRTAAR